MEKVKAKKVYYEVEKTLGIGLTSEVYKAFRRDSLGWTKQEVALKVIKSQKDVQVLKQEFERLQQIRSKYCVRVLAWENLEKGPALVLEYIHGVTLQNLIRTQSLSRELLTEILVQVRLGLQNLHRNHVFHGDLNLKNIMINGNGNIKLIDFGFSGSRGEQLLTPLFASPERKKGGEASASCDQFALQAMAEYLYKTVQDDCSDLWQRDVPRASRRRALGALVKQSQGQGFMDTQISAPKGQPKTRAVWQWLTFAVTFVFWLHEPLFYQPKVEYHGLNIRSSHWFEFSINGLPTEFGPLNHKKLRAGNYHLTLTDQSQTKDQEIQLSSAQTFILQPSEQ